MHQVKGTGEKRLFAISYVDLNKKKSEGKILNCNPWNETLLKYKVKQSQHIALWKYNNRKIKNRKNKRYY